MLSTYFSAQTKSCKIVMGGLMSLFCTTHMNGDSIWKERFQMRRTTTCACHLITKNTNPISSEEWCFVLFCHHQSTPCCLLYWWYIVWKEDWKWELVETWDVESNYEQGRESGSMQNPKPWYLVGTESWVSWVNEQCRALQGNKQEQALHFA